MGDLMVSPGIRFKAFTRDNFTCQYCGRSATEVIIEIDHKLPLSKGGKNNLENLVTACRECNRGKADMKITPNIEDFFEQLKQYDKEFDDELALIAPCRDMEGNVHPNTIYRVRNKKIKKLKYIIEYVENQNPVSSDQYVVLKQRCIESLPILKREYDLNNIINFEIMYLIR